MEKRHLSADSSLSSETKTYESSGPSQPMKIPGSSPGSATSATPFSQITYPDFLPQATVPLLKPTGGTHSVTCV